MLLTMFTFREGSFFIPNSFVHDPLTTISNEERRLIKRYLSSGKRHLTKAWCTDSCWDLILFLFVYNSLTTLSSHFFKIFLKFESFASKSCRNISCVTKMWGWWRWQWKYLLMNKLVENISTTWRRLEFLDNCVIILL